MKIRALSLWFYLSAALMTIFFVDSRAAWAVPATTTTLTLTSGSGSGTSISTIISGTVLTLTATVTVGGNPLTTGLVSFCDASVNYCTDIHSLGTAQLTSAGTAVLKFVPGLGSHSYRAVFAGTAGNPTSSSETESVMVTGTYPTTTTIAQNGVAGNYALTATVVGVGSQTVAPTGLLSFVDTTNANQILSTAAVGTATPGLTSLSTTVSTTPIAVDEVMTADFNGDGKTDVLISDSNSLSILMGNGNGTFTPAAAPLISSANAFASGDFNGDGKIDLVVSDSVSLSSRILLGNGDGTFTTGASVGTAVPVGVVVDDFNGDGNADLAEITTGFGNDNITIYLGNGDGSFSAQPPIYSVGRGAMLATADFNGDGKKDLLSMASDSTGAYIYLGNGDGTFTTGSPAGLFAGDSASFVVGDFNGDGNEDVAVVGLSFSLQIFLGKGDLTFTALPAVTIPGLLTSVAIGDFNADGKVDLALGGFGGGVYLFLGNGDGTFASGIDWIDKNSYVAIADLNGDGVPDMVLTSGTNAVSGLLTQLTDTVVATANQIAVPGKGVHAVLASYPGDSAYSPSVSATTGLTANTTTSLTLSVSPTGGSTAGQQVTLTATLSPYTASGQSSNGETVTFSSGTTAVGTGTLSNGTATLNTTAIPAGTNSLQAFYSGDGALGASISNTVSYTVTAVPTLVVTPASPSLTVTSAGSVTDALALTPSAGYSGTVSFKCSNLPQNATCTFQPATVTFTGNNNTAAVSVTIQTGVNAQAGLLPYLPDFDRTGAMLAAMLWMPGLFVAKFARRHRSSGARLNSFLLMFTLFGLCTVLTACSGGSSTPPPSTTKTPSGTYTAQVIATGTNGLSQNTAINLTVQ